MQNARLNQFKMRLHWKRNKGWRVSRVVAYVASQIRPTNH